MDSDGLIERDGARGILNADEGWPELQIQRGRRTSVPSDRGGGVKFAQAVVSQTGDGQWKMFIQSDRQVEVTLTGPIEYILKELKSAAGKDWQPASREWEQLT